MLADRRRRQAARCRGLVGGSTRRRHLHATHPVLAEALPRHRDAVATVAVGEVPPHIPGVPHAPAVTLLQAAQHGAAVTPFRQVVLGVPPPGGWRQRAVSLLLQHKRLVDVVLLGQRAS